MTPPAQTEPDTPHPKYPSQTMTQLSVPHEVCVVPPNQQHEVGDRLAMAFEALLIQDYQGQLVQGEEGVG